MSKWRRLIPAAESFKLGDVAAHAAQRLATYGARFRICEPMCALIPCQSIHLALALSEIDPTRIHINPASNL